MSDSNRAVISDAECEAAEAALDLYDRSPYWREKTRQALAAFLEARVPEAERLAGRIGVDAEQAAGFNACREQVLRGIR